MNFKEYLAANLTEGSGYKYRGPTDNPRMNDSNASSEGEANELLATSAANTPKSVRQATKDKDKMILSPAEERRAKARRAAMAKASRNNTFIGRILKKFGINPDS